jgi:uncharacterized protein
VRGERHAVSSHNRTTQVEFQVTFDGQTTMEMKKKMSLHLSESMVETITACLQGMPGLSAVYVHGSVAKGTCRPGSDLDLAFLFHFGVSIDRVKLLHLSAELEAVLKVPVHIGVLDRNSLVYAKEVIMNGKLIFCNDKKNLDNFLMYSLADYAELNEQRQRVIDSYRT